MMFPLNLRFAMIDSLWEIMEYIETIICIKIHLSHVSEPIKPSRFEPISDLGKF